MKIGHSTVIQATDGNLWVTNPNTQLWGTVYTITPTGTLLQTLAFSGSTNGAAPHFLLQASSGVISPYLVTVADQELFGFARPVGQGVKGDGMVVELPAYHDAPERADVRYSQHRNNPHRIQCQSVKTGVIVQRWPLQSCSHGSNGCHGMSSASSVGPDRPLSAATAFTVLCFTEQRRRLKIDARGGGDSRAFSAERMRTDNTRLRVIRSLRYNLRGRMSARFALQSTALVVDG